MAALLLVRIVIFCLHLLRRFRFGQGDLYCGFGHTSSGGYEFRRSNRAFIELSVDLKVGITVAKFNAPRTLGRVLRIL